jgi:hypothetical protein
VTQWRMPRRLTTDFSQEDDRPYFLWDEEITVGEFRQRLQGQDAAERDRLLGKMLREARDTDVWKFVTPREVAEALPRIERRIGSRRIGFWRFLIDGWRDDGLLDR